MSAHVTYFSRIVRVEELVRALTENLPRLASSSHLHPSCFPSPVGWSGCRYHGSLFTPFQVKAQGGSGVPSEVRPQRSPQTELQVQSKTTSLALWVSIQSLDCPASHWWIAFKTQAPFEGLTGRGTSRSTGYQPYSSESELQVPEKGKVADLSQSAGSSSLGVSTETTSGENVVAALRAGALPSSASSDSSGPRYAARAGPPPLPAL